MGHSESELRAADAGLKPVIEALQSKLALNRLINSSSGFEVWGLGLASEALSAGLRVQLSATWQAAAYPSSMNCDFDCRFG